MVAAAAAAGIECVLWFVIADLFWTFRGLMVGVDSPEGVEQGHFALFLFSIAVTNAVVLVAWLFLLKFAASWYVAMTFQFGNFLFGAFETATRDRWWLTIVAAAAGTAALLYAARRGQARRPGSAASSSASSL